MESICTSPASIDDGSAERFKSALVSISIAAAASVASEGLVAGVIARTIGARVASSGTCQAAQNVAQDLKYENCVRARDVVDIASYNFLYIFDAESLNAT